MRFVTQSIASGTAIVLDLVTWTLGNQRRGDDLAAEALEGQRPMEHAAAGGAININEVRELFGSSRKYILAFLEELDRQGVTIRRGDDRILRNV